MNSSKNITGCWTCAFSRSSEKSRTVERALATSWKVFIAKSFRAFCCVLALERQLTSELCARPQVVVSVDDVSWYHHQGQIGPPGSLVFARWAGWSAGQVGRHFKRCHRSVDLGLPANRKKGGERVREGSEGRSQNEEEKEGVSGTEKRAQGLLA